MGLVVRFGPAEFGFCSKSGVSGRCPAPAPHPRHPQSELGRYRGGGGRQGGDGPGAALLTPGRGWYLTRNGQQRCLLKSRSVLPLSLHILFFFKDTCDDLSASFPCSSFEVAGAPGALGPGPRKWSAGRGCRWGREGQGLAGAGAAEQETGK